MCEDERNASSTADSSHLQMNVRGVGCTLHVSRDYNTTNLCIKIRVRAEEKAPRYLATWQCLPLRPFPVGARSLCSSKSNAFLLKLLLNYSSPWIDQDRRRVPNNWCYVLQCIDST